MPLTEIADTVHAYLARAHHPDARVVPLSGDASDRRYVRVVDPDGTTVVLAVHASPFDARTLPFVNVAALFSEIPLPVPRILDEAGDLGILALEDLGDVTLQAHVGPASAGATTALYREAVAYIVRLQRRGHELASPRYLPYGVAFDVDKLTWEMDFFLKHYVEGYRGVVLGAAPRDAWRAALGAIVQELAAEPRVLCHRDYHSRNLMVTARGLRIIDFQDARLGPDTYDLVSLLRDSYVELPEAAIDDLIAHFLALQGRSGEAADYRRRFDVMAVQRMLKALGTFGFQAVVRQNPVYIQYMPRTLRSIRRTLASHARFAEPRELLAPHLPELA